MVFLSLVLVASSLWRNSSRAQDRPPHPTKDQPRPSAPSVPSQGNACKWWLIKKRRKQAKEKKRRILLEQAQAGAVAQEVVALHPSPVQQQLESSLWDWFETRQPSPQATASRARLLSYLTQHLPSLDQPGYASLSLAPFGSTVTGLCTSSSDLDICILDAVHPHGFELGRPSAQRGVYCVEHLAGWIDSLRGLKVLRVIKNARVPIVVFQAKVHGETIKCDLGANNRLAMANTDLLRAYCRLSRFTRPLAVLVKHWAKSRNLNEPSSQLGSEISFSSYTLTLLVVAFLQTQGQLPNLQSPALIQTHAVPNSYFCLPTNKPFYPIQSWDTVFCPSSSLLTSQQFTPSPINSPTPLRTLLVAFFSWLASLDLDSQVTSVRHGGLTLRSESPSVFSSEWGPGRLVVVDPFVLDRNTASAVQWPTIARFQEEARSAEVRLRAHVSWEEVCLERGQVQSEIDSGSAGVEEEEGGRAQVFTAEAFGGRRKSANTPRVTREEEEQQGEPWMRTKGKRRVLVGQEWDGDNWVRVRVR